MKVHNVHRSPLVKCSEFHEFSHSEARFRQAPRLKSTILRKLAAGPTVARWLARSGVFPGQQGCRKKMYQKEDSRYYCPTNYNKIVDIVHVGKYIYNKSW